MAQRVKQNLPPESQQWVRDIERRINDLEVENRSLKALAAQNIGQVTGSMQGARALSLSIDVETVSTEGTASFPGFGSGTSPFYHAYTVPNGYTSVSFMYSAWGNRTTPITANVSPKWDMLVSVNGETRASFTSTTTNDEFTGTFVGTVPVQPGDVVEVDSYCYMVSAGAQNVAWDVNLILFGHN